MASFEEIDLILENNGINEILEQMNAIPDSTADGDSVGQGIAPTKLAEDMGKI